MFYSDDSVRHSECGEAAWSRHHPIQFQFNYHLSRYRIPGMKIRQLWDSLSFILGIHTWIHTLVRRIFFVIKNDHFMNVLARYLPIVENVHQYVCNAFFHWHRPLQCRHNECDGVSKHQPDDCLLNLLFRLRSKKTQKLRVTINGQ